MSDDPQNMEFQVEADATEAVNASNAAARSMAEVVNQAAKLELALKGIFTKTIPTELGELKSQVESLRALMRQVEALPDSRQFGRVTRTLAGGGPATALRNATFQGTVATLRSDPAVQALAAEKELNKVLDAREVIYRRLRTVLPEDASFKRKANIYRKGLSALGIEDTSKASAEVREFERRIGDEKIAALQLQAEAENKLFDKQAQQRYDAMRREAERENRLWDQEQRRRADAQRRADDAMYRDMRSNADYENREFDRQQRFTPAAMRARAHQRVAQNVADRRARMDYQGGSAMLGIEAHTMFNYALIGAGAAATFGTAKQVLDLDNELKSLQATAHLTDPEMAKLADTIMTVGGSANISLKDIAEGTAELVRAGYSVGEITKDMVGPITNLAVATRTSFKEAGDSATTVLRTFGLVSTETKGVADALAELSVKTKIPLKEISAAFESVGEIARGSHVQFEEVAAGFKVMADAGLKTSAQLGTGMKMLIEQLDAPTAKLLVQLHKVGLTAADVDVKTNGLAGALKNMAAAGFTNSEAMGGMNIRAAQAYIALSQNIDGYEKLTTSIEQNNTAQATAQTAMESLESQGKRVANVWTTVAYRGLEPSVRALAQMASGLSFVLGGLSHLGPVLALVGTLATSFAAVKMGQVLFGMAAGAIQAQTAAEGLAVAESTLATSAEAAMVGEAALATETGLAAASFGELALSVGASTLALLANPVTAATVALTALIAALNAANFAQDQANQKVQDYQSKADAAAEKTREYGDRMKEIDSFIDMLVERHARLATNTQEAGAAAQIATQKFASWGLQIDKNITQVDTLIGRLIELRRQQAAAALKSDSDQVAALEGKSKSQHGKFDSSKRWAARDAQQMLHDPTWGPLLQRSGLTGLVQRVAAGNYTAADITQMNSLFRSRETQYGLGRGSAANNAFVSMMDELGSLGAEGNASGIIGTDAQLSDARKQLALHTVEASGGGDQLIAASIAILKAQAARKAKIAGIKDPRAQAQAILDDQALKTKEAAELAQRAQAIGAAARSDPRVSAAFGSTQAVTDALTQGNDQYQNVQALGGSPDYTSDPKYLKQHERNLRALAHAAHRVGNYALEKSYLAQANSVKETLAIGSGDVEGAAISLDDATADDATVGAAGAGRGGAHKAAAADSRLRRADAASLQRQLEDMVKNAGPDATSIFNDEGKLRELLGQWKTAREQEIRDGGGDDVVKQLQDFQVQASDFFVKVLKGNTEKAKKLMAELSAEAADETKSDLADNLQYVSGDLDKSLLQMANARMNALVDALAASDAAFAAKGVDPKTSADAAEARRKIMEDYAKKGVQDSTDLLKAWAQGQQDQLDSQREIADRVRTTAGGRTRAMSNYWGQMYLGDTHRYMGELASRQSEVDAATADVNTRQGQLRYLSTVRDHYQKLYDGTADGPQREAYRKQFKDAQDAVDKMEDALAKAKADLDALNGKVQPFQSASEAIAAAWKEWSDKSGANKGGYEQLADGLVKTLDTASGSLAKFFGDLEAGKERGKHAFADLARSILQSMLSTLNQLMANKLLEMLLGKPNSSGTSISGGLLGTLLGHGDPHAAANADINSTINSVIGADKPQQGGLGSLISHFFMPKGGTPTMPFPNMAGSSSGGGFLQQAGSWFAQLLANFHFAQGTDGIPGRDSVAAMVMPGEGILNKSAMDMVGSGTIRQMNAWGNRRPSQSFASVIAGRKSQPAANVWIVAPGTKPQIGKNDVLQFVSDDMLSNGQTKKLVKAIMNDQI